MTGDLSDHVQSMIAQLASVDLRHRTIDLIERFIMKMPIALAILIVGIILLLFGLNSSDSIRDSFSQFFSGQFSDRTMWFIVSGSVCVVLGLFGAFYSRRI